jgi:hypothetical protein
MQNNPAHTAAENYANSAQVPRFQAVQRPDPKAETARYIRHHADNLARCLVDGNPASDVAHYADLLVALIMDARAAQ